MAPKPCVYILHGNDRVAIEQYIASLEKRMGDPGMAELNTSRLDGRQCNLETLRSAAYALPFLTERRLVLLTNPFALTGSPEAQKKMRALLEGLPESTALVLVIHDELERGKWSVYKKHSWLITWNAEHPGRSLYQLCAQPPTQQMPGWILKQAAKMGGEFSTQAAQALAEHTGSDTILAAQEMEKLFTYTNRTRPVTPEDVTLLVAPGGPVDLFKVIELIAGGQASQAMRQLTALLDLNTPQDIFAMVIRHFRILLPIREILDEGGDERHIFTEMAGMYYLSGYIAQARLFSLAALEDVYHRLLEMDVAMKTSQMSGELALEMLVTGLARAENH